MNRYKLAVVFITLALMSSALALTSSERKLVQNIQAQVREAQADYRAAKESTAEADARAAAAEQHAQAADNHAATTDLELGTLKKQISDAAAREANDLKLIAKMKPVYDQCTSHYGLGAIAYGVGELAKHLLIAIAVLAVLGVGIYVLSFFFPIFGVMLGVILKFVGLAFKAIIGAVKRLLSLIPKPTHLPAPPPPPAT